MAERCNEMKVNSYIDIMQIKVGACGPVSSASTNLSGDSP